MMQKVLGSVLFSVLVMLIAVSEVHAASSKTKSAVQPVKDWELVSGFGMGVESIRLSSCDPVCATSRTRGNEPIFGFEEDLYYMGTRRGPRLGYFPIKFDVGLKGLYTQTWRMNANEPGDLDNRTLGLLLALRFPITDKFNVEVAHGVGYSVTQLGFNNGLIAESRDVSPMTVVGAEYRLNDTFAFFADARYMKNRHDFGGVVASSAANGASLAKGGVSRSDRDCDDGSVGGGNAGNNGNNGSSGTSSYFGNSLTETNLGAFIGIRVHAPFAWL